MMQFPSPWPISSPRSKRTSGKHDRVGIPSVEKLSLGRVQEGTARWLSGAFELALGRLADATSAFSVARQHYLAAEAPGPRVDSRTARSGSSSYAPH